MESRCSSYPVDQQQKQRKRYIEVLGYTFFLSLTHICLYISKIDVVDVDGGVVDVIGVAVGVVGLCC